MIPIEPQAADYQMQTINDILDIANLDTKIQALNIAALDVRRVCQVAPHTFHANANAKGIGQLFQSIHWPDDLHMEVRNEHNLQRIDMNLIINAIKFTTKVCITLRLRSLRSQRRVKFSIQVADIAIGIPRKEDPTSIRSLTYQWSPACPPFTDELPSNIAISRSTQDSQL